MERMVRDKNRSDKRGWFVSRKHAGKRIRGRSKLQWYVG